MSEQNIPLVTLGKHLKYVREQAQQSLAEVSGAVEIEELALERIESGVERPAEDILLLLISYFNIQDQEAVQMWELAGYDGDMPDKMRTTEEALQAGNKAVVMLMGMDTRTMYTDGLDIVYNQAGVTLQFTQATAKGPQIISRVGMSYEHAQQVLHNLQHAMHQAELLRQPRALPDDTSSDRS